MFKNGSLIGRKVVPSSTGRISSAPTFMAGSYTSTFASLAIGGRTRHDGAVTAVTRSAYFLGKIGHVVIVTIIEMIILAVMGVILFDVSLPTSPSRLLTLLWVFALGITAASLTGIAVGGLVSSGKSAPA